MIFVFLISSHNISGLLYLFAALKIGLFVSLNALKAKSRSFFDSLCFEVLFILLQANASKQIELFILQHFSNGMYYSELCLC